VENAFRSIVDGSPYRIEDDSDDAIYTVLGTQMAIRDLVYNMITVSSNLATNLLIGHVTADSVQATAERLGVRHMRVRRGVEDIKAFRQGLNNTATAADLATLLTALRDGEAVSPAADQAMVEVLLDQQFNTMIPAGLPGTARVAHKTGWITEIHHDAAIVYLEGGDPYVLVILTEGVADETVSARLGAEIASQVHAALRPGA
jgi:beta-lactamase class A